MRKGQMRLITSSLSAAWCHQPQTEAHIAEGVCSYSRCSCTALFWSKCAITVCRINPILRDMDHLYYLCFSEQSWYKGENLWLPHSPCAVIIVIEMWCWNRSVSLSITPFFRSLHPDRSRRLGDVGGVFWMLWSCSRVSVSPRLGESSLLRPELKPLTLKCFLLHFLFIPPSSRFCLHSIFFNLHFIFSFIFIYFSFHLSKILA